MAAKQSTDLVVAGADSTFLALQMPDDELRSLVRTNVGNRQLDAFSLDRVKIPSGGGTHWTVETLDGDEAVKELEGIIIHWATRRSYWQQRTPDGSPPDCSSPDGLQGHGNPGVACHDCTFNRFGTATKDDGSSGPGKACKEFRQLFILKPDSLLPFVVNATPGSLKSVDQYFNRLLGAGIKSTALVTKLALSKERSKGGTDFAMIQPTAGQRLDPEAVARVESVAAMYAGVFESHRVVTEYDDDGTD
jgi:hypothetical protein